MSSDISQEFALKPFAIAPLQTSEELANYQRLLDNVQSLVSEMVNSPGGCLLVTGYRGVGKTSFVNKALYDAEKLLKNRGEILVPVRLSLARGYSTDKLLRRLIREVYYTINERGVYDRLDSDVQRNLEIAFLRTSHQIKAALSQGLKEAIAHTESEGTSRSRSYSVAPSIGVDKIKISLASLSRQDVRATTQQETTSREVARERGLELEFLEYDDEIAENDLSKLIDLIASHPVEFRQKEFSQTTKIRSPEFLWKRLPSEFHIGKFAIQNFRYVYDVTQRSVSKSLKLVFVLDEIDKMTVEQAEEIFRSLKNLLLKGNVTFVLVSGKEFYYEWLLKRTVEDDILFGLFTRIIHVPLFSDEEFQALAKSLVDGSEPFPEGVLTHLLYKAKGTPREFLRELLHWVQWRDQGPVINVSSLDDRIIDMSNRLYPYILKVYGPIAEDARIDLGIKDHVKRSLHNWLEWMTILVVFDKESLMRPQAEGIQSLSEILLTTKVRPNFEKLFELLLEDQVIEQSGQIGDRTVYTFTPSIKAQLKAIDSSVAADLQSEIAAKERELRELLLRIEELVRVAKYEEALQLVRAAAQIEPANEALRGLHKELLNLKSKTDDALKARDLIALGDSYYERGQYERAREAYQEARLRSEAFPQLAEKLQLAELQMFLLHARDSETSGRYGQAIELLHEVINISGGSTAGEVFELRQHAQDQLAKLERVRRLTENIEMAYERADIVSADQMLEELQELAPKSRRTRELAGRISDARFDYERLQEAKRFLGEGRFSDANARLQELQRSTNQPLGEEATGLLKRSKAIEGGLEEANRYLETGDIQAVERILSDIADVYVTLVSSLPQISVLKERVRAARRIDNLRHEIERAIKSVDLDTAWEILDELRSTAESEESASLPYKRSLRLLTKTTLDMAEQTVRSNETTFWASRVARVLEPLLRHDPENAAANELLDTARAQERKRLSL